MAKSWATKDNIESVLREILTKKQYIALYYTLTNPRLIKQTFDCGYFWNDSKIIHAALESLNNQNQRLKITS